MHNRLVVCSLFLAAMGVATFACGKKPPPKEPTITETVSDAGAEDAAPPPPPAPKSLFERLGKKEGITKVVDAFVKNLAGNDITKKRFAKLPKDRVEKFRNNLIDQLCVAGGGGKDAGGDCEYTGKTMKEAHKGMKITEVEWNATVSALKAALDENKVGPEEQNDVVAAIAPMKEDIVEVKPKGKK